MMKLTHVDCIFFPCLIVRQGKESCVLPRLFDGPRDHRCSGNVDMIGNAQMPQDHARTTDCAMRTNVCTASDTHASSHCCVLTNAGVVSNLNLIVELDAVGNHGVIERPTVDAGVGPNFHIIANHDNAQLFYFFPAPCNRRETKPIATNHSTWVYQAPTADNATFPEPYPRSQHRLRAHMSPLLDHAQRPDVRTLMHHCLRMHNRAGMDAGRETHTRQLSPQLGQARVIQIGVIAQNVRPPGLCLQLRFGRNHHARGLAIDQLRRAPNVGQKTQRRFARTPKRRERINFHMGIPVQNATQFAGDAAERNRLNQYGWRHPSLTWRRRAP